MYQYKGSSQNSMIKDYSLPWNGKTYFEKSERAKLLEFNWKKLIFIFFQKNTF